MGLFDRSSSTTNTQLVDATTTNTAQFDQGSGSLNFAGNAGGTSVALSSSESLSNYESNYTSSNSYTTAIDAGAVAAGRDVSLAGINAVAKANADSISMLSALAEKSIDSSKTLARDAAAQSSGFLEQALTGFNAITSRNTQSADDRIVKVMGMAAAVIAAVVVLPALLKGGARGVIA